jgi:hypothetical protein
MLENATISNIGFGVALVAIGLAVFGVVSNKHAIMFGLGGIGVGLLTKPGGMMA